MKRKINTKHIPFFSNSKDDLHCFQAALKMALTALSPKVNWSDRKINKITGFSKRELTWDTKAIEWLYKNNFQVHKISTFDYTKFAHFGKSYLKRIWRKDIYDVQNKYSNIAAEQKRVKQLLNTKTVKFFIKKPTISILNKYLLRGWVAIIHIDVSVFDDKKDYSPHSIIITKITSKNVFFHDPGLPPEPNRIVDRNKFAKELKDAEILLIKNSES